jgi:hypothetical protein
MLIFVLLFGVASVVISLIALFRRGAEGTFTSFSCAVAAAAIAVWVAAELVPAARGSNRIISALALATFTATAVFWGRSGFHARRRRVQSAETDPTTY